MRERTTWNRDQIRTAAMNRRADPYTMNQDHPQPGADEYVIGGPSDFAEDVNADNRWEDEYKGGQVARNEIGMPDMRPETFNHPEKTAAMDEATLLKKANICVKTAKLMLPKTATEAAVEDQAVALMNLPDYDLFETFTRLAGDEKEGEDKEGQAQGQGQESKQAGEMPPQFKENAEKKKEEAKAKEGQGQDQGDKKAQTQGDKEGEQEGQQAKKAQQDLSAMIAQELAQQLAQMQAQTQPQQAQTQPQQAQTEPQQAATQDPVSQANIQALVAQMVAQQLAQMQPGQQAGCQQTGCGQPSAQTQPGQQAAQDPTAEMFEDDLGIQMEAPVMDTGDVVLGPEDDVLKTLFANDEAQQAQEAQEAQQGGQQQQQKQAGVRTASTRTVGTKPTAGVSRLGGSPASGGQNSVDQLSSLWQSAPDVREAFGLPTK